MRQKLQFRGEYNFIYQHETVFTCNVISVSAFIPDVYTLLITAITEVGQDMMSSIQLQQQIIWHVTPDDTFLPIIRFERAHDIYEELYSILCGERKGLA